MSTSTAILSAWIKSCCVFDTLFVYFARLRERGSVRTTCYFFTSPSPCPAWGGSGIRGLVLILCSARRQRQWWDHRVEFCVSGEGDQVQWYRIIVNSSTAWLRRSACKERGHWKIIKVVNTTSWVVRKSAVKYGNYAAAVAALGTKCFFNQNFIGDGGTCTLNRILIGDVPRGEEEPGEVLTFLFHSSVLLVVSISGVAMQ